MVKITTNKEGKTTFKVRGTFDEVMAQMNVIATTVSAAGDRCESFAARVPKNLARAQHEARVERRGGNA